MQAKKFAELSEGDLEQVGGGAMAYDPGDFYQWRYAFSQEEINRTPFLRNAGIKADTFYCRSDLNSKFKTSNNHKDMKKFISDLGIKVNETGLN